MAYSIADVIQSISKNYDALWKYRLLDQWPTIIGDLNTNIMLQKITNDSVILGVHDSCWLTELYHLSPLLLNLINKSLEKPHIKKIHFRLIARKNPSLHEKNNGDITPIYQQTPIILTHKEQSAANTVADNDLKLLLISYRNRCQKKM